MPLAATGCVSGVQFVGSLSEEIESRCTKSVELRVTTAINDAFCRVFYTALSTEW